MLSKKLILASNSPRREQLLKKENFKFEIVPSSYNEHLFSSDPVITATTFAREKALDVYNKIQNEDVIILSADTVVFLNGEILGKPQNEKQASLMLKQLSDKTHSVTTGFCIKCGEKEILDTDTTFVTFNDLSNELINEYIASGLYKGKAGAYGIQGKGSLLVKRINGDYFNVVGLPVCALSKMLRDEFNVEVLS